MKRKWWKSIVILPIIGCTLYAGGYIAQFLRNYQFWERDGHFAGDGTSPHFPSLAPKECFSTVTDLPYGLYGLCICLVAFALLAFFLMRMGLDRNGGVSDRERNLNYSNKGTYGWNLLIM